MSAYPKTRSSISPKIRTRRAISSSACLADRAPWCARACGSSPPAASAQAQDVRLDDQSSVAITQASVQAAFRRGNVIIIGRGGQAILRGRKDVLHVRIVAPIQQRVARLVDEQFTSYDSAAQMIKAHDRASQDYLKHYYDIDWDDPLLYHLVINTGMCSVEMAAHWIQFAVQVMHLE